MFLTLLCATALLFSCEKTINGYVIPPPSNNGSSQNQNQNQNPDPQEDPGTDPETPTVTPPDGFIIVGYATYWDKTMPNPEYLTHICYAFAHIKNDFESLDIKTPSRLTAIKDLKKVKPTLKVLLSIGGWGAGNFSEMAASETHRKKFAQNCLAAVKANNLDGIDLDWEYPTSNDAGISSSPDDTKNFTLLVKELRTVLGKDLLLTMASASNADYVNFKEVTPYLNFVNVMTYDMGKPPYHNAALYKSSRTKSGDSHNCDGSVKLHYNKGVPYEKIVLGIPFYGHGNGSAYTTDCLDYRDIKPGKYKEMWDNTAQVPFLVDDLGNMVLSYDNARSVGLKAEYIQKKGLRGAMYWNIEADDDKWTLSRAISYPLIGTGGEEPEPADAFLATNQYVQKYLEEVNYPNTGYEDTDKEYYDTKVVGYPGGGPSENNIELPPTYTISWTASSSAQKLTVMEGTWSREYSLNAGVGEQSITNLVPKTTYEWTVTASGKEVASGSFVTTGLLHQVYFEPNVRNGRDLGGWKGLNGKTVAFHKLYRGGAIHGSRTNDKGKAEMLAEGIRAEVDLREASDIPSKSPLGSDIAFFAPGFDSGYNHMVRDNPAKVKETFCWVVARLREGKPVYFHCAAGRDRTGTLAVLLLGTLGVSESDMAKDYELTYFSPKDWGMSKNDDGTWYYGHVRTAYSYKSIRKTIFNETKTEGGTYQERIAKYLLKIGVPQKDIDDLRNIMLK
jgi:chitinase